jgi:hypothetical protein
LYPRHAPTVMTIHIHFDVVLQIMIILSGEQGAWA